MMVTVLLLFLCPPPCSEVMSPLSSCCFLVIAKMTYDIPTAEQKREDHRRKQSSNCF